MSSLRPGPQPSESGAAAPWGPSLPNPSLGPPPTSWDPVFATQTAWLGALAPLTGAGACWGYMGTGKGGLDMVAGGCREEGREPGRPLAVPPAPSSGSEASAPCRGSLKLQVCVRTAALPPPPHQQGPQPKCDPHIPSVQPGECSEVLGYNGGETGPQNCPPALQSPGTWLKVNGQFCHSPCGSPDLPSSASFLPSHRVTTAAALRQGGALAQG